MRVGQLTGPGIDEDVWDRVLALWRAADARTTTDRRDLEQHADRLRDAVVQGWVRVDLLMDGPRLLAFAFVAIDGGEHSLPPLVGAIRVRRSRRHAAINRAPLHA